MEPEQKCSLCGKVHFDNCDPADVPKTSEQARKLAQRCYVQTVEAAAEVRARFSQYLKQLQDEEAAIDTFLISFEKFIWHICILNRLNWQMGFRELDWPLALNFIKAKKCEVSKAVVALLQLLVDENEEQGEVVRFQENILGFWADIVIRLVQHEEKLTQFNQYNEEKKLKNESVGEDELPYTFVQDLGEAFLDAYSRELAELFAKINISLMRRGQDSGGREGRMARYQTSNNADPNSTNAPNRPFSPTSALRDKKAVRMRDDVVGIVSTQLEEMAKSEKALYEEANPPKQPKTGATNANVTPNPQPTQPTQIDPIFLAMQQMLLQQQHQGTTHLAPVPFDGPQPLPKPLGSDLVRVPSSVVTEVKPEAPKPATATSELQSTATTGDVARSAARSTVDGSLFVFTTNHLLAILIALVALLIGLLLLKK